MDQLGESWNFLLNFVIIQAELIMHIECKGKAI